MSADFEKRLFSRILEPVARCLTPEAAGRLAGLRADPKPQERMEALAEKCSEGRLTKEEEAEYSAYVSAANLLAILQSKAKRLLAGGTRA